MTHRKSVVVLFLLLSSPYLSLRMAAAASVPQGPLRSPTLLGVVDANGVLVGNVIGAATPVNPLQSVVIAYKRDKRTVVVLQVFRDHFEGNVPALLFLSPNCTGTPFLPTADQVQTLTSVVAIAPPGSTVYLAEPQATSQTITVGSELGRDGSCTTPAEAAGGSTPQMTVVPAFPSVDLNTLFTPPFSLRP